MGALDHHADNLARPGGILVGCTCGWTLPLPAPDEQAACDALMEHAYAAGWHECEADK